MANRATPFKLTNVSDTWEAFDNILPVCWKGMEESSLDHKTLALIFHKKIYKQEQEDKYNYNILKSSVHMCIYF